VKPATPTPTSKAPPPPVKAPAPAAKAPPPPPRRSPGKHVAPSEPVTVASDEMSITAAPTDRRPSDAQPEVVVVPEPEKAHVGAHGPDSNDEVLDVLQRLVPSNGEEPRREPPGDLRARLARTAALKKPGSRERQEQRENGTDGPSQQ
jgi:hypothetical protein